MTDHRTFLAEHGMYRPEFESDACGVGLVMPQAQASAMMPFPDRAGAASSFNGLCQMLLSACVGLLVGHLLKNAALPLPLVMSALGVTALVLFRASRDLWPGFAQAAGIALARRSAEWRGADAAGIAARMRALAGEG